MQELDDDGVPLPDPELMKKWRAEALRDLPPPEDFAALIAGMRWASELDRIGAENRDLPDRLTSPNICFGRCWLAFPQCRY